MMGSPTLIPGLFCASLHYRIFFIRTYDVLNVICCPNFSRRQKSCVLGAGGSSVLSLASFLVCPSLYDMCRWPTQVRVRRGWGRGRSAGRRGSDSAWALQSATSHMGSTNPHTQLLTSAGPLEVAGDRTTCGHGKRC